MSLTTDETTIAVPDELESARAKLVYVYLAVRGEATANELCDALGMDKGSALTIAGTLRERGYVTREGRSFAIV